MVEDFKLRFYIPIIIGPDYMLNDLYKKKKTLETSRFLQPTKALTGAYICFY